MKTRILFLTLMLAIVPAMLSCDRESESLVDITDLPTQAGEFITQHFPDATISSVIREKDGSSKSYDVYFSNGDKIEFDSKGKWKDIECNYSRVPESILPDKMKTYVATNHDGHYTVEIDRNRNNYEITLDNRMELVFDLESNFIRYDH